MFSRRFIDCHAELWVTVDMEQSSLKGFKWNLLFPLRSRCWQRAARGAIRIGAKFEPIKNDQRMTIIILSRQETQLNSINRNNKYTSSQLTAFSLFVLHLKVSETFSKSNTFHNYIFHVKQLKLLLPKFEFTNFCLEYPKLWSPRNRTVLILIGDDLNNVFVLISHKSLTFTT